MGRGARGIVAEAAGQQRGASGAPWCAKIWGRRGLLWSPGDRWGQGRVRRGRPRILCSACEPVGQHGGGGLPREPWIVAVEPERQTPVSPCPPRGGHRVIRRGEAGGSDGSRARAVRGPGHLQEGRQGLRPGRRRGSPQDRRDGDHVGVDDQPGPGAARAPDRRAGDLRGDGGHRGLLEAVLLPARGRRVRGDVGQRPAGEEPARPQDRRLRRDLAGPARRARAGPRLVRATRADPAAARPDPDPDRDHPRTRP